MSALGPLLRRCFGRPRRGGRRLAALDERHVVGEAGYEVRYSAYSVTYSDGRGQIVVGAELDEEGRLVLHDAHVPRRVAARIARALRFLGVALAA